MIEETNIRWQEILETLFRRKWLILAVAAAGLAVGGVLGWLQPDVFTATARIFLTAQPEPGPREDAMSDRQITAELALLKSPSLIRSVLDDLEGESDDSSSTPGLDTQSSETGFDDSSSPPQNIKSIADRIIAVPVGRSNLVEVSYTDRDPERAASLVNRLLEKHVKKIVELASQTTSKDFLEEQGELLSQRWNQAREALFDFRDRHGLLEGDENQLRQIMTGLETARVDAGTDVLELRAKIAFLKSELTTQPETIATESRISEDESVTLLRERILQLEIERSEKLSNYTPTSVVVRDLDRRIEEAKRLLETKEGQTLAETTTASNPTYQTLESDWVAARSELTAALARMEALESQIESYRGKLRQHAVYASDLARLESNVEIAREANQDYLRQAERARFSSAQNDSEIVNVSIVEPAVAPLTPEPAKRGKRVAQGGLAGLLLGIGLAYLRDWLDPTVKSSAEASRLSGLPVVSVISAE